MKVFVWMESSYVAHSISEISENAFKHCPPLLRSFSGHKHSIPAPSELKILIIVVEGRLVQTPSTSIQLHPLQVSLPSTNSLINTLSACSQTTSHPHLLLFFLLFNCRLTNRTIKTFNSSTARAQISQSQNRFCRVKVHKGTQIFIYLSLERVFQFRPCRSVHVKPAEFEIHHLHEVLSNSHIFQRSCLKQTVSLIASSVAHG
jgi:hypothetical protein